MDKTQHKLAMEFYRSEIKTLATRLAKNKTSRSLNQRYSSIGEPLIAEYDMTGEKYWWAIARQIIKDKKHITALHIAYSNVRGKCHLPDKEKEKKYDEMVKICWQRVDDYISKKQIAQVSECTPVAGPV